MLLCLIKSKQKVSRASFFKVIFYVRALKDELLKGYFTYACFPKTRCAARRRSSFS